MNSKLCAFFISVLTSPIASLAQGTFGNPSFESAQVPVGFPPYGFLTSSAALPSWTAYAGANVLTTIQYNVPGFSTAGVFLLGPTGMDGFIFDGLYAVRLYSGLSPFGDHSTVGASIAQTGTIPVNMRSLLFFASADLQVSFDGHILSTTPVHVWNSVYTEYGADISSLAGQSGELRFSVGPGSVQSSYLDFITFSNVSVPEPSSCAVAVLGALLLGVVRRRRSPKL